MTDTTDNTTDSDFTKRSLLKIPNSPLDFQPAKPDSYTQEMKSLLRDKEHWDEIKPYLKAIAGETQSIHGSPKWDEAVCIIKVQEMCQSNGYTLLASAELDVISPVFKRAFKSSTGMAFRQLTKQGRQLRLEHMSDDEEPTQAKPKPKK